MHAPGILEETLSGDKCKGILEAASSDVPPHGTLQEVENSNKSHSSELEIGKPELRTLISAGDFEKVAGKCLTPKTWAFYSSAATDLITHSQNKSLLRRIMIQPRILRDVKTVSFRRNILGYDCSAPFFISPTAMARLAHQDGELALARAANVEGVIHCVGQTLPRQVRPALTCQISNNASYPLGTIVQSGDARQPFFFQLYVNADRKKTNDLLLKARELGIRAIFVTVDAPVPGKREADERIAAGDMQSAISGAKATNDKKGGGLGRLMAQYIDKSLTWEDLAWIKETSGLPVVLKGVQSVRDARKAVEFGADGIFLSNHGGRSLDT